MFKLALRALPLIKRRVRLAKSTAEESFQDRYRD